MKSKLLNSVSGPYKDNFEAVGQVTVPVGQINCCICHKEITGSKVFYKSATTEDWYHHKCKYPDSNEETFALWVSVKKGVTQ